MKKISNPTNLVSVLRSDIRAINQMLYSASNGVDLSPILNDLIAGGMDEDLTKMRVGLTFKGLVSDFVCPGELRFEHNYKNQGYRYEVVSASYILGSVKVKRSCIEVVRNTGEFCALDEKNSELMVDGELCFYNRLEPEEERTIDISDWERFARGLDASWLK